MTKEVLMYNKKSRVSAILLIVAAALLLGFMILLPNLQYQMEEGDNLGTGLALIFLIIYGYPIVYLGAIPFVIVALVFGIKMLRQQDRKRLVSLNVRMLIASLVLLPVLAVGFNMARMMVFNSTLGLFPTIYAIASAVIYVACPVTQIVTIILLKKSPEETVSETAEEQPREINDNAE